MARLRPPPAGAGALWFRRLPKRLGFLLLFALVCALYAFYTSAGTHLPWPAYGVYHDLQADAFLAGQLNLPIQPAREILQAKDPYDPINMAYWWLDASYYKGKYFIYWGPVPALFQAAVKWAFHIKGTVGDQYLTFAFLCLAYFFGALLNVRMARRLFPRVPRWLVVVGGLALACANPTLHAATTGSTYHTAIIAAQAWLVGGVLFAFDAVWYAHTARSRRLMLLAASASWGLAIASRVTLLPAIALLVAITALFEALADERWLRRALVDLLWLGAPLSAVGFALLWYNHLRFDSWLEFGANLMLSGFPRFRIAAGFVPANLYSYTLRPWFASCQFPYLYQEWWLPPAAAIPRVFLPLPPGYNSPEPVIGALVAVPLAWLAPWAFVLSRRHFASTTRHARSYVFCLLTFCVMATVTGLVGLATYGSTMRYLSDVTHGLVLLSLLGAYALWSHRILRHVPRAASLLVALLSAASIVIGLLIGYQGYNGHFTRYHPSLDRKITKALSLCNGAVPRLPAWMLAIPGEPVG